jgi:uncharacterized membrane protein YqiK
MDDDVFCLGGLPVKTPTIVAKDGSTVNITIVVRFDKEPDSLRKFAEEIGKKNKEIYT